MLAEATRHPHVRGLARALEKKAEEAEQADGCLLHESLAAAIRGWANKSSKAMASCFKEELLRVLEVRPCVTLKADFGYACFEQ